MQSITGNYKNESCKALAEKVRSGRAADTLNIKVNMNLDLSNRDPVMVRSLMACMTEGREFVMYEDGRNYTIFIPVHRLAVSYKGGKEYERDISKNDDEFITRVKMAMAAYEHFIEPIKQIEFMPGKTLIYV